MYFNEIGLNTVAISILTAALIFLGAAYWRLQNKKDQKAIDEKSTAADIQKQLNEFRGKLEILGQSVQPLTAAMSAVLVKQLTHFHEEKTDSLLAKVGPPNRLTVQEERELSKLMDIRMQKSDISELERNSAKMLLLFIERSRLEDNGSSEGMDLALVGVPKAHE